MSEFRALKVEPVSPAALSLLPVADRAGLVAVEEAGAEDVITNPAKRVRAGSETLTVGTVGDGQLLKRSGYDIVGIGSPGGTPELSLDAAYHYGTDGIIYLDSTRKGVIFRDASPSIGASEKLFSVESNGGSPWLAVLGDGKVGIGTYSPEKRLHVYETNNVGAEVRIETVSTGGANLEDAVLQLKNRTRQWALLSQTGGSFFINDDTASFATRLSIDTSGNVGINCIDPVGQLEVRSASWPPVLCTRTSAATNTILSGGGVEHRTTEDMVDGFGSAWSFNIRDSAGVSNGIASIQGIRAGADNTGDLAFYTTAAGSGSEKMRITSAGQAKFLGDIYQSDSAKKLGLFGATPVVRTDAYTQTYSTATRTFPAYTADDESAAYTGAADGEAKLSDLNALRTAYETLRAHAEATGQLVNQLIDDMQSYGLLQ